MAHAASAALMELRVHMCQSSIASKGIRDFWLKNYKAVKSANMKLPILLREAAGAPAKLTAAYSGGKEQSISVDGMSEAEFGVQLNKMMQGP
eukprot:CAMPEP_0119375386 /NCGR_PEP_ID=MMETSP1334-20130426/35501_1 /TAXON_ID=127549 /ORGANISM="Calcidiscus leptoporus, Strain RCC1130" /LENGTH=91 /DNA_ID=CAMNT_0007393683 /DNA_START=39 /DNA_END=314 /DNA_ORIENTATION=+